MAESRPLVSVVPFTRWDPQAIWRGWAAQRQLDAPRLERAFGIRPELHRERPCAALPTEVGAMRYRYLDGRRPKALWERGAGGCAHWYGLAQATPLLAGGPLWLVNGEASVWACWQSGVPAVCTAAGEGPLPRHLDRLVALRVPIRIAYDLDTPGRLGATGAELALRAAGIDATAVVLPEWLGEGGDVDDLHRAVGDAGLADALARLPAMAWLERFAGGSAPHAAEPRPSSGPGGPGRRRRSGREWAEWGKARARAKRAKRGRR